MITIETALFGPVSIGTSQTHSDSPVYIVNEHEHEHEHKVMMHHQSSGVEGMTCHCKEAFENQDELNIVNSSDVNNFGTAQHFFDTEDS